jgi:hypothetical protein
MVSSDSGGVLLTKSALRDFGCSFVYLRGLRALVVKARGSVGYGGMVAPKLAQPIANSQ